MVRTRATSLTINGNTVVPRTSGYRGFFVKKGDVIGGSDDDGGSFCSITPFKK